MASSGVCVYDPDGLNPYGRELAVILSSLGHRVEVLTTRDAEWAPPRVTTHAVLPNNRRGASRLKQAMALVEGLSRATWHGLRRDVVVVVLTRGRIDEAWLAALGRLRIRLVVVVHDPVPKFTRDPRRMRAIRALQRSADVRVVHSAAMGDLLEQEAGLSATVCDIVPYVEWWSWAVARWRLDEIPRRHGRLLMLGQLRLDKGLSELSRISEALSPEARREFVLCLCGRGSVERDVTNSFLIDDRTGSDFVPDSAIAHALAESDVLLAPYRGATQSATVALALSAGLQVLAYDDGAVGELVTDDGLVEAGNAELLARRLREYLEGGRLGTARTSLADWQLACGRSWDEVVSTAYRAR